MYGANESGLSALIGVGQSRGMHYALAGLQAGVLGAIVMVACLMAGSLWDGRSIWVVVLPNLFASTFFGSGAYRNQLLRTSWAGIALIVVNVPAGSVAYGAASGRGERTRWLARCMAPWPELGFTWCFMDFSGGT